jgi:hypothetical protein
MMENLLRKLYLVGWVCGGEDDLVSTDGRTRRTRLSFRLYFAQFSFCSQDVRTNSCALLHSL